MANLSIEALVQRYKKRYQDMLREIGVESTSADQDLAMRGVGSSSEQDRRVERSEEARARGGALLDAELAPQVAALEQQEREKKAANIRNAAGILLTGAGAAIGSAFPVVGTMAGAAIGSGVSKLLSPLFGGGDVDPTGANDLLQAFSTMTTPTADQALESNILLLKKHGLLPTGMSDSLLNRFERWIMSQEQGAQGSSLPMLQDAITKARE